jgi:hypothetical protein
MPRPRLQRAATARREKVQLRIREQSLVIYAFLCQCASIFGGRYCRGSTMMNTHTHTRTHTCVYATKSISSVFRVYYHVDTYGVRYLRVAYWYSDEVYMRRSSFGHMNGSNFYAVKLWIYIYIPWVFDGWHTLMKDTSREDCVSVHHNTLEACWSNPWDDRTDNGLWLTLANGGLSALMCDYYIGCKQEALYM